MKSIPDGGRIRRGGLWGEIEAAKLGAVEFSRHHRGWLIGGIAMMLASCFGGPTSDWPKGSKGTDDDGMPGGSNVNPPPPVQGDGHSESSIDAGLSIGVMDAGTRCSDGAVPSEEAPYDDEPLDAGAPDAGVGPACR